jgi:LysM repeat protein
VYKARRGDTPKRVSKRFGISPDPILDMNDVKSPNSSFMPGAMIELPIPSDFVRSIASLKTLELLDPVYPKRHRYRRFKRRKSRSASSSEVRFDGASRRSRM